MGVKKTDGLLPPATEDDTIFLHLYASLRRYCRSGVGSAGADFVLQYVCCNTLSDLTDIAI